MILSVHIGQDIELFLSRPQQFFLFFNHELDLSILEVIVRYLLIVYHIISVSNWALLTITGFLSKWLVGF